MVKRYKTLAVFLMAGLIFVLSAGYSTVFAQGDGKSITILFTHDLHDHLLPVKDLRNGFCYKFGRFCKASKRYFGRKETKPRRVAG